MGEDEARAAVAGEAGRGRAGGPYRKLVVQLGSSPKISIALVRAKYAAERTDVQRRVFHPIHKWMAATLDGRVEGSGAVFEAKFMLPWGFSEEAAAEKHMAQLQHNMWVVAARTAVLSIVTGGGKWVELTLSADPLYQHLLLTAERKFWRCVQSGEVPRLFGVDPPRPRLEAVRTVDMSGSNSWAELAATFGRTRAGLPGARSGESFAQTARTGRCQRGRRPWF